jgi:hypothetical protein
MKYFLLTVVLCSFLGCMHPMNEGMIVERTYRPYYVIESEGMFPVKTEVNDRWLLTIENQGRSRTVEVSRIVFHAHKLGDWVKL